MKTADYTLRFLTPAFLGNAEQNGQWRTPPIKALLRQWWRVAVAEEYQFNVTAIRRREAELFGVAADKEGDSRKSLVRLRLQEWGVGTLNQAPAIGMVSMGKKTIHASLYSGYGPIAPGPKLKADAAIQAGAETQLRLAFPAGTAVEQSLALMNAYGVLGGRSRNGWGSFELVGEKSDLKACGQDWKEAMQRDWPHALGKDENGLLIWQSSPQPRWEDAMKLLAQARADLRRAVPDRLMLAYPDTKNTMPGWGKNERVPNSIRFKVRSNGTQFFAIIFHMPCRPADKLWEKLTPQKQQGFIDCFVKAHAFMDGQPQFHRAEV